MHTTAQEEQGLKQISILVPCYNEEENIRPFREEIRRVFRESFSDKYTLELLYIDDGSRDGTLERIRELAREDPEALFIQHRRDRGLLGRSGRDGGRIRRSVLRGGFFIPVCGLYQSHDLRRSRGRVAVAGLHHPLCVRDPVLLYGRAGGIYGKDLYGGQETPCIPVQGVESRAQERRG